jgi:hypothetical protein
VGRRDPDTYDAIVHEMRQQFFQPVFFGVSAVVEECDYLTMAYGDARITGAGGSGRSRVR